MVSPDACKEMLGHLKACDDKEKMTRLLPARTVVAHKTGSVDAAKTDAGIIYTKSGPIAVCVLTSAACDCRSAPFTRSRAIASGSAPSLLDATDQTARVASPSRFQPR